LGGSFAVNENEGATIMRVFKKLWFGQYSLATAFWGFYVCGFFLVAPSIAIVAPLVGSKAAFAVGFITYWSYLLVASAAVWMSARRSPFWGWWARAVVLVMGIAAIENLIHHHGPLGWMDAQNSQPIAPAIKSDASAPNSTELVTKHAKIW
jgi:hypothetical protein